MCGFHSFLGQNRSQFSISFFIFALLFLLFDLEILLVYPYVVSGYNNEIYGLSIVIILLIVLAVGFVFEFGKSALKISSRQNINLKNVQIVYLDNLTKTSKLIVNNLRYLRVILKKESN
jgi:NADH-ubiquinone oxidoreductase chain 3